MLNKIIARTLIILSGVCLLLSLAGIGAVWFYNEPLTREATSELQGIDDQLAQAETTLESTHTELERALRLVDTAQIALVKLTEQSDNAGSLLDGIKDSLDNRLLPELKTTRERIENAKNTLENLRNFLQTLSAIPLIGSYISDEMVAGLIDSANTIDAEIANAEDIAQQASAFVGDTSYLLGGDLTETRDSLQNFLATVGEYQDKVADWRMQVADLIDSLPGWIDNTSIGLTIFLFWFGLSQFGLFLHGRMILLGENPLDVLRS